jgi:hypothetical protein
MIGSHPYSHLTCISSCIFASQVSDSRLL